MAKLTTSEEIAVWSSIRGSINTWVGLLVTLLTSGTALFFVALGVIHANVEKLGADGSFWITFGLFLAILGLSITVWHISNALNIVVKAAITLEDSLFGKGKNVHKITSIVNASPLFGIGKSIGEYYKIWGFGLLFASVILTFWRLFIWINLA